eukprot:1397456-Rhodomonas_salina.1
MPTVTHTQAHSNRMCQASRRGRRHGDADGHHHHHCPHRRQQRPGASGDLAEHRGVEAGVGDHDGRLPGGGHHAVGPVPARKALVQARLLLLLYTHQDEAGRAGGEALDGVVAGGAAQLPGGVGHQRLEVAPPVAPRPRRTRKALADLAHAPDAPVRRVQRVLVPGAQLAALRVDRGVDDEVAERAGLEHEARALELVGPDALGLRLDPGAGPRSLHRAPARCHARRHALRERRAPQLVRQLLRRQRRRRRLKAHRDARRLCAAVGRREVEAAACCGE